MALCCEKGVCYNCDECFNLNYKCKSIFFLLVASDDDNLDLDLAPLLPELVDTMQSDVVDAGSSSSA
ncbi:hypothetical protein SESBI_36133 [Sesbania bispinosa]|nr:hypothetical protein SESBI_36133 [Sesbania bispinosa]